MARAFNLLDHKNGWPVLGFVGLVVFSASLVVLTGIETKGLEFDGIVVGSPAMRTNYSNLATRWITVSWRSAGSGYAGTCQPRVRSRSVRS